ncbi:MAG: hypothetical protein N2260_04185 [Syntrophobacterales bacterium]|nr:hypothetical protein [Syntrophobacterales bacterium]
MNPSLDSTLSNFLESLFLKISFKKENLWISLVKKASPLVFHLGIAITVINLFLFLSLAIRLKSLDTMFVLAILVALYPVFFFSWRNILDLLEKELSYQKDFTLPDPLRKSIGAILLGLSFATLFGGLLWGISSGNVIVVVSGVLGAFLFYQWFSAMFYPSTIGISFRDASFDETPLVFLDWLILKLLVFYLFIVELSVIGMAVTPFVIIVDLIRAWSVKSPRVIYEMALIHQGIWVGSLMFPVIGYFMFQGWVFVWNLPKRIWIKSKEDINEKS